MVIPKCAYVFYSSCVVLVYHCCLSSPFLVCIRENFSFGTVIWENKVFDNYSKFRTIATNVSSWQSISYLDNTLTTSIFSNRNFCNIFNDFLKIFVSINLCKCCFLTNFAGVFLVIFLKVSVVILLIRRYVSLEQPSVRLR